MCPPASVVPQSRPSRGGGPHRRGWAPQTGASLLVYLVLLGFAMLEQLGRTTSDTKTPLIERPQTFLASASTLWDPTMNFGELQNQAYGYLFPQGPFFLLGHLLHVAPWITERLWSMLIVVVAVEGMRLLARSLGFTPWSAWVSGMALGLSPRILSEVGVRSAEILPTAVLPWVVLPIVLAGTGRLAPRRAALFSAVAFLFSGVVNATATVAGLPLVAILLVWAARRRLVPWSMLGWWALILLITNYWWAASLLRLRVYSPPFFDFVEDAKTTTGTTGFGSALRGLSNWVNYTYLGDQATWPTGYDFSYQPVLVATSGLLAAIGVLGLVWLPKPWRSPLVIAACFGVFCVTVAHASPVQSPLAPALQQILDGGLALLRNVSKAEIMIRLPLCLGIGAVFARAAARAVDLAEARRATGRPAARIVPVSVVAGLLVALVLGMAQPAVAMRLRSPGWTKVPDYWTQTADYLDKAPGRQRAWIVPGTGFGLQSWGWTFDEPFQGVAKSPWTSRSQVPLTPPPTIRILSSLERFLESGSGSPNLGAALGRLGIGYVVVRHDLDERASDTTTDNLISIALARSRGVERVKLFGTMDLGPAIEIYRVTTSGTAPDLAVRPLSDVVTVASASSDVIQAVTEGLVAADQPVVVQGDDGWDRPADVVGDTYRDRERNFGRVHNGDGAVRAVGEPKLGKRVVQDYPANETSRPVRAVYDDDARASASSTLASTGGLGAVEPESAPYAAVDDDASTAWRSAYYADPMDQWLQVRWPQEHEVGKVQIRTPVDDTERSADVRRWRVSAGGTTVRAVVDPFTGLATADLTGVSTDRLRIAVDQVRPGGSSSVSILEVSSDDTPYDRTLKLPDVPTSARPSFVFTAQPETRACISTLLGPDCSENRKASSEESTGIDRSFRVDEAGEWNLQGTAVARSTLGTVSLLNPLGTRAVLHASSQLLADPGVSIRLAYDGATTTSWIADPRDATPEVTVDFDRPRLIDRLAVTAPASPAVAPTTAVIRSKEGTRRVELGEFGQFAPLRTNRLTITFANPTRGVSPVGVGELYLPPDALATPLNGADVTGAVCGLGPVLYVDGKRYETAVRGLIGDVVAAGPLSYQSCSGPISLESGEHRMRLGSTQQFQPVTALLRSSQPARVASGRSLSRASGPITRQVLSLGPGAASILTTTRNDNIGWEATLDGKPLSPMVSDGWAQAFRVPAGDGGRLVITYAPQRPYLVSLFGGLAVAALVLLLALVLLTRTRLRPARLGVDLVGAPPGRRRWWPAVVLGLPLIYVMGGIPVLVGFVLGTASVLGRRRRAGRALALAMMVAGYVLQGWLLRNGPAVSFAGVDVLVGAGFALMVATLVPRPAARRR